MALPAMGDVVRNRAVHDRGADRQARVPDAAGDGARGAAHHGRPAGLALGGQHRRVLARRGTVYQHYGAGCYFA